MDKLSGLILDVYDDHDGSVLRSIFPEPAMLPGLVKQAERLTPELADQVPDDLFALVLHDGDVTLRKFACIDAGNTALSVEYFVKTAHRLPENARQVAAGNLVTACGWYGIDPPAALEKAAYPGLLMGATLLPGTTKRIGQNFKALRGTGGNVIPPRQLQAMKGLPV